jgi:hypothetical protein
MPLSFRSADGTCNNLEQPQWGSSFMPFLRFLPPDYSDGIQVSVLHSSPHLGLNDFGHIITGANPTYDF